jgi:hypothetical protein
MLDAMVVAQQTLCNAGRVIIVFAHLDRLLQGCFEFFIGWLWHLTGIPG